MTDPYTACAWDRIALGLGGVILGFLLNELNSWFKRRRKHKSYWYALRAEVTYAQSRVQSLLSDNIQAPLYRLPDACFKACYPELLAEGVLSESDSIALMAYFSELETLNRGLDRASDAKDEIQRGEEFERNKIKALRLGGGSALSGAAKSAISAHIK